MQFDASEELYKAESPPKTIEAVTSIYIEPLRAVRKLKPHASLSSAFTNILLLYLIATAFRFVIIVLAALLILKETGPQVLLEPQMLFSIAVSTIYLFGLFIVFWLGFSAILYLPAKLLGGRGTFLEQAYMVSYIGLALIPLCICVVVSAIIPHAGLIIAFLATTGVSLYGMILLLITVQEIHRFSALNSVISFLISLFISLLLVSLLSLLFFPSVITLIGKLLPL